MHTPVIPSQTTQKYVFYVLLSISLIMEVVVRYVLPLTIGMDGFALWAPIDNVMHFFWGANFFLFGVLFLRMSVLEGLLLVYAWQMFWESIEIIGDMVMHQPVHMLDHFFFDGIKDTLVDLAGAAACIPFVRHHNNRFNAFRTFMLTHLACMAPLLIVGTYIFLTTAKSPDLLSIVWIACAGLAAGIVVVVIKAKQKRARHS